MADAEQKDVVKGEPITIKIKDQDGAETVFKVRTTTKFEKIFASFTEKRGLNRTAVRFMFDGNHINPNSTVQALELEEGDVIECMQEQVGGRA